MQVFVHKNYPEVRVILKKLGGYQSSIYIRVDKDNKPMTRKKINSYGDEEYTLVIHHDNLIAEGKIDENL